MSNKKPKLLPCNKWNHHKFSPTRAEIILSGEREAEQKCIFCEQTRILVLKRDEEDEES